MTQWIGGPGVGLPPSRALYPAQLFNAPPSFSTNMFGLAAGDAIPVPAGEFMVSGGASSSPQWLDPTSGQWISQMALTTSWGRRMESDGFNFRVANLTGAATGATVTGAGSAYAQATTTVTPSSGNSVWMPIIGGTITGSATIVAAGTNYSMPPLVFIDAPPSPGVQATAVSTLSGGAVNAITFLNRGAGYLSAPNVMVVPNPFDPNINIITPASVTVALGGAGTLTAVLLVNFGTAVGSAGVGITLAVSGAGSSATATTVPVSGSWLAPASDTIVMQRC